MARDLGSGDGQWNVEDWLFFKTKSDEASVLGVGANALQARRTSDKSAFEYVKSLKDDVEAILISTDFVRSLARVVEEGVRSLATQEVASAQQLSDKFKNEEGAFSFSFGGLSTFFGGLEALVGTPNAALAEYMRRDHCDQLDSAQWFAVKNAGEIDFLAIKRRIRKRASSIPRRCRSSSTFWLSTRQMKVRRSSTIAHAEGQEADPQLANRV